MADRDEMYAASMVERRAGVHPGPKNKGWPPRMVDGTGTPAVETMVVEAVVAVVMEGGRG